MVTELLVWYTDMPAASCLSAAWSMLQLLVWAAMQTWMLATWLVSMIALITCYLAGAALRLAPMIILTVVTARLLALSTFG